MAGGTVDLQPPPSVSALPEVRAVHSQFPKVVLLLSGYSGELRSGSFSMSLCFLSIKWGKSTQSPNLPLLG